MKIRKSHYSSQNTYVLHVFFMLWSEDKNHDKQRDKHLWNTYNMYEYASTTNLIAATLCPYHKTTNTR